MLTHQGVEKDFSLKGKTAVITGGAAGIGYAAAEFLARKGANLILADLNPVVHTKAKALEHAIAVEGDVTNAIYRQRVLDEAKKAFHQVDILINCAGIVALEQAESLSEEDWDKTMEINVKASFMMAQLMGNHFIQNKVAGSIVNMGSQAGVVALDRHVAYALQKGQSLL